MIKPAHSVSFLLSINIFVWQNVLYFPNDLRRKVTSDLVLETANTQNALPGLGKDFAALTNNSAFDGHECSVGWDVGAKW